jgi:dihydroorotate dehydrogenase
VIAVRNMLLRAGYQGLLRRLFFRIDPEIVHDRMVGVGAFLGRFAVTRVVTGLAFSYRHPWLRQDIFGIRFENPIGLAAGFDKNAQLTQILPSVGFGFAEVGSVTGEPCVGNAGTRLWRLKKSRSLLVYYGLKNDGADAIAARLRELDFTIPIGINVAKTNSPDTVEMRAGVADYAKAYTALADIGSYMTINISCPNAFGGEPFCDPRSLEHLLEEIFMQPKRKPVLVKLSPDLSHEEIDLILEVVSRYPVDGIICANLTKLRENAHIKDELPFDKGGMSGKVQEELANEMISYIYQKTRGRLVIIGLGGVFCAQDAYEKILRGASLVQLITGMIYEGPQVISDINRGLVALLKRDGYTHISQAIGAAHRDYSAR